jgi:hypothetical protein
VELGGDGSEEWTFLCLLRSPSDDDDEDDDEEEEDEELQKFTQRRGRAFKKAYVGRAIVLVDESGPFNSLLVICFFSIIFVKGAKKIRCA